MTYVRTLKRIRENKTNYRKRAAILIGRHFFVTVKVSNQNIATQVLKPTPTGDIVLASAHSRELEKKGWKGALNNLPACYLTGMLLAKKALEIGVKNAILYIGKDHFTSRVAACVKGIIDGGVAMPASEESLPDEERLSGQHIAKYAETLKKTPEEYNSRFSAILKNGLNPEDYPSHFEEIKSEISGRKAENPAVSAANKFTAEKEEAEGGITSSSGKEEKERDQVPQEKEGKEEKLKEKKGTTMGGNSKRR